MAKIELTVKQIMKLGLWDKVCEYKDWSPYILREGRIDEDELVEFDDEFEKKDEINKPKYIEDLAGSRICHIQPLYNGIGDGVYMLEIYLDDYVLKIEREHSEDHWLEWTIEPK